MNNQLEHRKNRARKHPKAETAQAKNTEQEKAPAAGKRRKEKIADFTADYRDALPSGRPFPRLRTMRRRSTIFIRMRTRTTRC